MSDRQVRATLCAERRRGRRRSGGYTLIEVMMAAAIMIAGAVGMMAMQQATTRGNTFARQMTTATQINRAWLERIRVDSLRWNNRGTGGLGPTSYLVSAPAAGGVGDWMTPPVVGEATFAFDYSGAPTIIVEDMFFCAHLRLNWVVNEEALRAEVRTFWPRRGSGTDAQVADRQQFQGCAVGGEATVSAELVAPVSRLHAIQTSTVIRWTPLS